LLLATTRSVPEICETGEQGGSTDGLKLASTLEERNSSFGWIQINSINELLTEKADLCVCDYRALRTSVRKDGK
jgi:hypothetical protein